MILSNYSLTQIQFALFDFSKELNYYFVQQDETGYELSIKCIELDDLFLSVMDKVMVDCHIS